MPNQSKIIDSGSIWLDIQKNIQFKISRSTLSLLKDADGYNFFCLFSSYNFKPFDILLYFALFFFCRNFIFFLLLLLLFLFISMVSYAHSLASFSLTLAPKHPMRERLNGERWLCSLDVRCETSRKEQERALKEKEFTCIIILVTCNVHTDSHSFAHRSHWWSRYTPNGWLCLVLVFTVSSSYIWISKCYISCTQTLTLFSPSLRLHSIRRTACCPLSEKRNCSTQNIWLFLSTWAIAPQKIRKKRMLNGVQQYCKSIRYFISEAYIRDLLKLLHFGMSFTHDENAHVCVFICLFLFLFLAVFVHFYWYFVLNE